ncbi:hypothetical protein AWB67_06256 [Caballeronia terrestris]|uniref:Ferritin-like domain-containing protein n=1 Tax=Caballeronia terrestris TaxID=1226301 RepID=A0A158KQ88_9BURK|nr:hypothetical protein [Caballeronia terrestris]SAL82899.1 hypothetical protein AWB67_06256 [Caballeronia terrestris]
MSAVDSPSLHNMDLAKIKIRHAVADNQRPVSQPYVDTVRYAKCVEVSKRIRWEIDRDVLRHREFDFTMKFLPDGLSFVDRLPFLDAIERRLLSQIQGRSYANIFGLVERFIGAKMLEVSRDHWLGDQIALEALVRFTEEELKHQELFRRIETMIDAGMPPGYTFEPRPDDVASVVLGKSTWSVLALTCLIELFTQAHYRASIEPDSELSPLFKDVFLFHWKEESQHAILDELEWVRENTKLMPHARDAAVDDLISLVGAVDAILQAQSAADGRYFIGLCDRSMTPVEIETVMSTVLAAYRFQYIVSGVQIPRFGQTLNAMISPEQALRISTALAPIMG